VYCSVCGDSQGTHKSSSHPVCDVCERAHDYYLVKIITRERLRRYAEDFCCETLEQFVEGVDVEDREELFSGDVYIEDHTECSTGLPEEFEPITIDYLRGTRYMCIDRTPALRTPDGRVYVRWALVEDWEEGYA